MPEELKRVRLTPAAKAVVEGIIRDRGLGDSSASTIVSSVVVSHGTNWDLGRVCIDPERFAYFARKHKSLSAWLLSSSPLPYLVGGEDS